MAQTLRQSLTAKSVTVSHSESLELVSKMLGAADWNTLSALIQSGRRESAAAAGAPRAGRHAIRRSRCPRMATPSGAVAFGSWSPTQVAPIGQEIEPLGHSDGPASSLMFCNEPSVETPDYQPF